MSECVNCGNESKHLSDRDYCDTCQWAYDVVNTEEGEGE